MTVLSLPCQFYKKVFQINRKCLLTHILKHVKLKMHIFRKGE